MKPRKYVTVTIYTDTESVYAAEEGIRELFDKEGFNEGTDFIVEDSGDCHE